MKDSFSPLTKKQIGEFHGDPADRILVAAAQQLEACLVTADDKIAAYLKKHLSFKRPNLNPTPCSCLFRLNFVQSFMAESCEFPKSNASGEAIKTILRNYKIIAIVGLSDQPDRPSFGVASYLKNVGYQIIPVNPKLSSVLGEKAYPDLKSIPGPVDIVDIFRKPSEVPPLVEEAILKKAKVIWMQEGIVNCDAAEKARAAGLQVVMDKCILKEHHKFH